MNPNLTTRQLVSAQTLINNLVKFRQEGYGYIKDLTLMIHPMMKDTLIIKYIKEYTQAGELGYDFKMASIDPMGKIEFIENNFKNAFEQSAFISVCRELDINDPSQYHKID